MCCGDTWPGALWRTGKASARELRQRLFRSTHHRLKSPSPSRYGARCVFVCSCSLLSLWLWLIASQVVWRNSIYIFIIGQLYIYLQLFRNLIESVYRRLSIPFRNVNQDTSLFIWPTTAVAFTDCRFPFLSTLSTVHCTWTCRISTPCSNKNAGTLWMPLYQFFHVNFGVLSPVSLNNLTPRNPTYFLTLFPLLSYSVLYTKPLLVINPSRDTKFLFPPSVV